MRVVRNSKTGLPEKGAKCMAEVTILHEVVIKRNTENYGYTGLFPYPRLRSKVTRKLQPQELTAGEMEGKGQRAKGYRSRGDSGSSSWEGWAVGNTEPRWQKVLQ